MDKATAAAWIKKVEEFIGKGEDKCYAENALNEIFAELDVRAFSYENYYIDEIDNLDDHARVTAEILAFDEADSKYFKA
jgi:CTP:phosphocholine cytidylyltransferase-like protein